MNHVDSATRRIRQNRIVYAVGIRNLRCSMGTLPPYGLTYAPMVATITALMECIRFSASSKTTL